MLLDEALDILADRLRTIDGLTVTTDTNVAVVAPMAAINAVEMDYNESFVRGAADLTFDVRLYVSQADNTEGLYEQRRYLSGHGERSVRAALETQLAGGDALLKKVTVDTGRPANSENHIVAEFSCRAHIPGEVAT